MESVVMSHVCSYELVEGVSCNKELPVLLVVETLTFLQYSILTPKSHQKKLCKDSEQSPGITQRRCHLCLPWAILCVSPLSPFLLGLPLCNNRKYFPGWRGMQSTVNATDHTTYRKRMLNHLSYNQTTSVATNASST